MIRGDLKKMKIFWVIYFLSIPAIAQVNSPKVYVIDSVKTYANLNQYLSVFEDTSQTLTFKDILKDRYQKSFKPLGQQNKALKLYKTYWAKLVIQSNLPVDKEWVLNLALASHIEAYVPDRKGKYVLKKTGRLIAADEREISNAYGGVFKVKINTLTNEKSTLYVRVSGIIYPPKFKVKLVTLDEFHANSNTRNIIESLIQGALWLMLLYNALLILLIKDKIYIYYSLYILSYIIFFLTRMALGWFPKLEIFIAFVSGQMTMAIYFQFMRVFLGIKKHFQRWDKIILFWIRCKVLFTLIFCVIMTQTLDMGIIQTGYLYTQLVDAVLFFINIFFILKIRNTLSIYFTVGSLFLIIGIVLTSLSWVFRSVISDVISDGILFNQIGVFLEFVLFSAGLGYRERKNEQDKRLAQAENARILKEQKEVLEQSVTARTKEIIEQKEEIIQQAEELKTAYDQLNELGQFKNHMTDMIVHDLKNPLASIIGMTSTDQEGRLDKAKLTSTAQQMLYMVQDLLDVQRAEEAEVQFNISAIEMGAVIKEVIAQQRVLANAKNINLRYDALLGDIVKADADILVRILSNLISNAIKFTRENGEISLLSSYIEEDALLKIEVQDNGVGIPSDQLPKIFDKFHAIEQGQQGNFRSTGLGLTFCKMAVENLGGTIGAVSTEGLGTTFWFTLPLVAKAGEGKVTPLEDAPNLILEEVTKVKQALRGQDLELAQVIVQQIRREGVNHSYPTRLARIFDTVKAKVIVTSAVEAWMQMLLMDASNEVIFEDLLQLNNG